MSTETDMTFTEKIKALLSAEAHPEPWSAWIRIALGIGYMLLSLCVFCIGRPFSSAVIIQWCAILFLIAYSLWQLVRYKGGRFRAVALFTFVIFDVSIITLLLGSLTATQALSIPFRTTIYSSYIIVIMFTMLHNRRSLSLFCGILSFVQYSALFFCFPSPYLFEGGIFDYCLRVSLIAIATMLAAIVSRRNLYSSNRVISFEQRYQNLVHRLPEMLFTLDEKGTFVWTNKASYALLGVHANAMANRTIQDFLTNPEPFKLDKTEFRATFQIKDFNGALKYVDCHIQPLKEDGDRTLFEGMMADVTDREIALFQREEMVNRLYQYQKMESLGTLATGMAHDFNNNLQIISDIAARTEMETAEPATKKMMSIVSENLIDAKFLISELLSLGRKRPLDFKPMLVQAFVKTLIEQFHDQLGQRYAVVGKMPEAPLWVQGDADYFKRVFQNLVDNSRDAMPQGGSITIECMLQENQGKSGMAVIRVSDTGTGIPQKIKDKVFDPFFTTKKPGKGTGLGLALVQRIVSLHNGTIAIEKTDVTGTTFRIEIPESRRDDADVDTKEILLNRRMSRVLILDDDPKIRGILKFFLAEFGYPLCEASNVEEGARELSRYVSECELVIMDWKLGADDPHAVIKSLRAIKPELIVIVVSGYPARPESIKEMNIFKWVTKPYDKNQLDLEIQRALYFHKKK